MTRIHLSFAPLFILAIAGCASSPGRQVQQDVQSFRREQTPEQLLERGRAFAAVGDLTRAEEYFAAAIAAGGDEATILPLLLTVCVQDGRYRVAIEYAERYVKKHPSDSGSRFVLGTLYAAVGDHVSARTHFENVLAARPLNAEAHFALASLMHENHMGDEAANRHFREYIRLNPDGPHADEARSALAEGGP